MNQENSYMRNYSCKVNDPGLEIRILHRSRDYKCAEAATNDNDV
jgi:hypothetical protein